MADTPLRRIRKARNLTLKKVADALGVDPANLSRIERGAQQASPELAERISGYYGGEVTEIQILYPRRYAA